VRYSADDIQKACKRLGKQISDDYLKVDPNIEVVVVGMLKGAFVFLSDLTRCLSVPNAVDFMIVSSYHGTKSSGSVMLRKDMSIDPSGKHILIVEDLIDTGTTLSWLMDFLSSKSCASVKLCCLIDKVAGRPKGKGPKIDYVGFTLNENKWVVGYGMDFYRQQFRSLPFVAVPSAESIEASKKKKKI